MLHGRTVFHALRPYSSTQRFAICFVNGSGRYFQGEKAEGEQRGRERSLRMSFLARSSLSPLFRGPSPSLLTPFLSFLGWNKTSNQRVFSPVCHSLFREESREVERRGERQLKGRKKERKRKTSRVATCSNPEESVSSLHRPHESNHLNHGSKSRRFMRIATGYTRESRKKGRDGQTARDILGCGEARFVARTFLSFCSCLGLSRPSSQLSYPGSMSLLWL